MPSATQARLVLGVDAGGTTTRAVVTDLAGTVLGRGRGGGLNPRSSAGDPVDNLAAAVGAALEGVRREHPTRPSHAVLAVSGAAAAGHARVARVVEAAWERLGLTTPWRLVPDLASAFAAGSPEPEGIVLIAGTGSVVAAVRSCDVVDRADGYGWLGGDDGGAVTLGRRAVRACLRALDGRGEVTALVTELFAALGVAPPGGNPDPAARQAVGQQVVAALDAGRPADLGRLAPVVARAAAAGDAVAVRLLDDAAGSLLAGHGALLARTPHLRGAPVVLAGALAVPGGPLSAALCESLTRAHGRAPLVAGDTAAGAVVLALAEAGSPPGPDGHARLLHALGGA